MSIRFEGDMTTKLNQFGPKAKRAMVAAAAFTATGGEAWMKANASWTDRTGAARNGLRAQMAVETNKVAVIFYHSVPYGVFLEVRWGGKYAIIEPALTYWAPLFAERIGKLLFD